MRNNWLHKNSNKTVRAAPVQHEEMSCVRFVLLLDSLRVEEAGVWYSHIPLGGKRPLKTAKRLKAMGAKKGVYDYLFMKAGLPHHWLEFKYGDNKRSAEQISFDKIARGIGDTTSVVYDEIEALNDLVAHGFIDKDAFEIQGNAVIIRRKA